MPDAATTTGADAATSSTITAAAGRDAPDGLQAQATALPARQARPMRRHRAAPRT